MNLINLNNIILILEKKCDNNLYELLLNEFIKNNNLDELINGFKHVISNNNNNIVDIFINNIQPKFIINYLIDDEQYKNEECILEKINIKHIKHNINNDNIIKFFKRITTEVDCLDNINSNIILVDNNYNLIDGKYKFMKNIIEKKTDIYVIKFMKKNVNVVNNVDYKLLFDNLIKYNYELLYSYYNINKFEFNKINFINDFLLFFRN